ncbi:MAG TPA: CHASE3 domain-containing protein [Chryseolinea sp.]|nr:CHASE3 domain-containing protein [Chryseolinea sp.]
MTKDSLSKTLFWTVIVVLISVSLLTYRNLNNYIREVRTIRHSNKVLKTLEIVLSSIKDAETSQRGYQLTRDATFLGPYHLSVQSLPIELQELDSLLRDNTAQSARVDTLQELAQNHFNVIGKILTNARKSSLFMDRYERDLIMEGKTNMDRLRKVGARIRAEEEKFFRERESSETDLRNIAPLYLLIYGLVPMVGLVLLFTRLLDGLEKRRKAEQNLKENIIELRKEAAMREFSQMTLRKILDNSLNGIMAFSSVRNRENKIEDFCWILANTVSVTSAGLAGDDFIGKRLLVTMPESKSDGLFDCYCDVVETGVPRQFEHHQLNGNTDKWMHFTVVKLEDGCIVTFSDISERKLQDSLLEERALLLNEAEGLANMGSWKWTEKDNLIWSDGLYNILKKERAAYQPSWNSFLENVHPDDAGLVLDFVEDMPARRTALKLDYRIFIGEEVHYLSMNVKAVRHDDSEQPYILGTVVDITERKVYENQLKQYTSELQRSNEDLEQFAYIASHDLQEPLRKIRAFGDRLLTKFHTELDVVGRDYLERMQSAAARMQLLIEDILAFSKISRNYAAFERLNMRKLMDEVVDDLETQVRRVRGTVRIGNIPNLNGDRAQVKRLFQNLISNGLKFHKEQESPIVEINGTTMKGVQVREEFGRPATDADYAYFSVKDNGIGFDEKYKEKIFNIFQRLHGRNEYEGTGIGLSICRKIVVNHRGLILTKSEENVGSEFIVILPLNDG